MIQGEPISQPGALAADDQPIRAFRASNVGARRFASERSTMRVFRAAITAPFQVLKRETRV